MKKAPIRQPLFIVGLIWVLSKIANVITKLAFATEEIYQRS